MLVIGISEWVIITIIICIELTDDHDITEQ